jgi:hypothetical protein
LRTIIIYTTLTRLSRSFAAFALLFGLAASAAEVHEYTVTLDASLDRLRVEAHFASALDSISARDTSAADFLLDARECQGNTRLRTNDRHLRLPNNGISCLTYVVDLARAASADPRNRVLAKKNIVASPVVWLWRPDLKDGDQLLVNFELVGNVQVAVPWAAVPGEDNSYRISASPENAAAPAAFGELSHTTIQIVDVDISVTLLQPKKEIPPDAIFDWVHSTATNLALVYGRFPSPGAHVVVFPVGPSTRAGRSGLFGRVMRDGGETIEFRINENKAIKDYYGHWTATHEFSHLLLPYMFTRHRWISEGFAQYHQNVLLARAGTYTDAVAWQNLYNGFERGRKSSPALSPNEAALDRGRASNMKVYWSGAALALMADVELRRRSNGNESLDVVLDRLQHCCLPSTKSWDGLELLRKMDSLLDAPVFVPLYREIADTSGFPNVQPLFEELGLDVDNEVVTLRDDAVYYDIREAITARRIP